MPLMDGLQAIAQIRRMEDETTGRTPIVALTAHAYDDDRVGCLAAGADGYLSKPLEFTELLKAIEQYWK